ncbi:hypothetical protein [Anaerofustis sp.]|uniref:hypothetical protein n=1 Tax=Anaerofustis sp. TaxID=1872517 RepID=UPI0025BE98FE|nr:hypothetical protein [Anaerofustis sp.]
MSRKNIWFIIITVALVLILAVFAVFSGLKKDNKADISGEYKLQKVAVDKKEVDYSNLNFYYVFNNDSTGSIIFEDVKSDFTYELKEEDNQLLLVIKQNDDNVLTYGITKEDNGIVISHDTLGKLYLLKEEVPESLKQ